MWLGILCLVVLWLTLYVIAQLSPPFDNQDEEEDT
jgi:hypothetical protein